MHDLGLDPEDAGTFVLIADGKAYVKSDAAIRLSRYFRPAWRSLGVIKIIPRQLRDWAYDVVARRRYRWFGRLDSCMVPTSELKARFIEE
jgi:predicted DCC family thiol-disulfide oxidoreductase YuxK